MRVFFLFMIVASACGDDDVTLTDGGRLDGGPRDSGRRDTGGNTPDSGPGGDMNDSFAEAAELPLGNTGLEGVLNPAEDKDYYTFEAMEGDWLVVATEANSEDNPDLVDTVITLFDATMTQVAENDDRLPRSDTDSEIIYRVPTTGRYYVEVQEFSDWVDMSPEGLPSYTYTVKALVIDPTASPFTEDAETGNDETTATPLAFSAMGSNFLVGTFASATDVDVFSFTVTGTAAQSFSAEIMPATEEGYGSTTTAGEMWITNEEGDILVRLDNRMMGQIDLSPSLEAGDYFLWVEHGGTAGANDFYVFKNFLGTENDPETGEAMNDTLAGAQELSQTDIEGVNTAFILAHLISDTDVDYFSFEVADGEQVSAVCGSASSGSGVQGLSLQLRDDTDAIVDMVTEMVPNTAFIEESDIMGAGTYYMRLSKTGQDPEVTGDFVRCAVRAAVPE
jgi:hypothetical protein